MKGWLQVLVIAKSVFLNVRITVSRVTNLAEKSMSGRSILQSVSTAKRFFGQSWPRMAVRLGEAKLLQVLCMVSLLLQGNAIAKMVNANHPSPNIDSIYTDDKQNVILTNKQSEFVIKLKSNPSTGYSWFLRDYDLNILSPIKHAREAASGGLIGAPGYETFTFKVKSAAYVVPLLTSLRFVYMRPASGVENSTQMVFHISLMGR